MDSSENTITHVTYVQASNQYYALKLIATVSQLFVAASVARLQLGIAPKVVEVVAQIAAGSNDAVDYVEFFQRLDTSDDVWIVEKLRAPYERTLKPRPKKATGRGAPQRRQTQRRPASTSTRWGARSRAPASVLCAGSSPAHGVQLS